MSKLIRTKRTIATYSVSDKDIISEDIISEDFDDSVLELLLSIVNPRNDDPLLIEGYILNQNQLERINDLLKNKMIFDFNSFYYVLECTGIYDWSV